MRFFPSILLALALTAPVAPAAALSPTPAPKKAPSALEITSTGNRIQVVNAPVGGKLEIYSVVGIKVMEVELKRTTGDYEVNIAKGYYIIRIGEIVRKVAIR